MLLKAASHRVKMSMAMILFISFYFYPFEGLHLLTVDEVMISPPVFDHVKVASKQASLHTCSSMLVGRKQFEPEIKTSKQKQYEHKAGQRSVHVLYSIDMNYVWGSYTLHMH